MLYILVINFKSYLRYLKNIFILGVIGFFGVYLFFEFLEKSNVYICCMVWEMFEIKGIGWIFENLCWYDFFKFEYINWIVVVIFDLL